MKNIEKKNQHDEFTGYEEARKLKEDDDPKVANPKAVKAAVNRINPDENTQDRG